MKIDLKAVAEATGELLKEFTAPLFERVKALEDRPAPQNGERGDQGERGVPGEKGDAVIGEHGEKGDSGDRGIKGDQGEKGEKGEQGEKGDAGGAGEKGGPGIKGDCGERGEKGDPGGLGEKGDAGLSGGDGAPGEKGLPGDRGERGEPGERGEKGLQGELGEVGIAGRSLTIDDVRDFLDAGLAKWMLEAERRFQKMAQDAIAAMPKPKDGIDGLSADDFSLDSEARLLNCKRDGIVVKAFKIPYPQHKGVWHDGEYEEGHLVTFGGSIWNATRDTDSKPGTDDSWLLCVKKGRDGRDAR
jgi:Collagen triple helix repeat (20 copies)